MEAVMQMAICCYCERDGWWSVEIYTIILWTMDRAGIYTCWITLVLVLSPVHISVRYGLLFSTCTP
jgi:hypothetical protein